MINIIKKYKIYLIIIGLGIAAMLIGVKSSIAEVKTISFFLLFEILIVALV